MLVSSLCGLEVTAGWGWREMGCGVKIYLAYKIYRDYVVFAGAMVGSANKETTRV
jgi:hypothetical protein